MGFDSTPEICVVTPLENGRYQMSFEIPAEDFPIICHFIKTDMFNILYDSYFA
jgi:hypothetical protein